ncbi:MAG: hypothetical protein ABR613_10560 [Actinomycetota bacterium]
MAGRVSLTDAQVRDWLLNFYVPERLANPSMRDLLRAHGRLAEGSPAAVARQAQALMQEPIEALRPADDAPSAAWRPYRVTLVYLQRRTSDLAGSALGLSLRQMSRERTRAIRLLRAELENP